VEGSPEDGHSRFPKLCQRVGGSIPARHHGVVLLGALCQQLVKIGIVVKALLIARAVHPRMPAYSHNAALFVPCLRSRNNAVKIVVHKVQSSHGGQFSRCFLDVLHLIIGRTHPCAFLLTGKYHAAEVFAQIFIGLYRKDIRTDELRCRRRSGLKCGIFLFHYSAYLSLAVVFYLYSTIFITFVQGLY